MAWVQALLLKRTKWPDHSETFSPADSALITSLYASTLVNQAADLLESWGLGELLHVIVWKWHWTKGRMAAAWPMLTWSLEIISFLVTFTRFTSSTAKAGKEIIESSPASISLDVDALGSMENRIDWMKNRGSFNLGSTHSYIQYLETMNLASENIPVSLPIYIRTLSY